MFSNPVFSCSQRFVVNGKVNVKMLLWILCLASAAVSHPTDEYRGIISEGELYNEAFLKQIVPSGYSPRSENYFIKLALSELVSKDKPSYKRMLEILNTGITKLGLTFNIYDDKLREAALAVYKLLLDVDDSKFQDMKNWAKVNINSDMFDYAVRLASLYNNKFKNVEIPPPFIQKPNYFVNGEAMWKAMHLKVAYGLINKEDSELNQYYKSDNLFTVNTNYSGWNLQHNGCDQKINYFKEDVALNTYYFGVHLLHPFWMTNEELDQLNPRHAEHYYFTHKQLMTRYVLEKEHIKRSRDAGNSLIEDEKCDIDANSYNSYLMHDYGLPFPIKSTNKREWNDEKAALKSIDIAIRECISRGVVVDNGTVIQLGSDYNIDLLSKLIRANLDSTKSAKIVRSIYGYGGKGYPIDEFNPAPSVLHYPQTSLRDQTYWHLIDNLLDYYRQYRLTLEPLNLENYVHKEITISNFSSTEIATYFDYYTFSLNHGLGGGVKTAQVFAARQRRLQHMPFVLNFSVNSTVDEEVVMRLFLGPHCDPIKCWMIYSRFFELDVFKTKLKKGINSINWSTEESSRFSSDQYFNMETKTKRTNKYDIFKFPKNLVIPKGLKEGLNFTLFAIITRPSDTSGENIAPESNSYKQVLSEVENMPLGFPFHRQPVAKDWCKSNCGFYAITVFHKSLPIDSSGYFSPNLY